MFNLWYEDMPEEGKALLHCQVDEWDISIAHQLDVAWVDLQEELVEKGYDEAITVSPNHKFCEYMAGEEIGAIIYDNQIYGVYRWELKSPPPR